MGPPIVWLASDQAAGVHDQRIVATEFNAAAPPPYPGSVGTLR